MRKLRVLTLSLVLMLALGGQVVAQEKTKCGQLYLKEYQTKDADEKGIIKTLMQLEGAFNSHNLEKLIASFAKDAVYRPCGSISNPIASKQCQDTIKYNFGSFRYETFYDPEITVEGENATVKMLLHTGGYLADYTVWLHKVGKVWLITKNDFENERYKGD